nr:ATP-dependent DNA helicase [Actinomycetota bacterium]
ATGPLAAKKPGYAPRDQQVGYARAVARAIQEARPDRPSATLDRNPDRGPPPSVLLADCPTGTGKTLASLVPVALAGVPAIYSTATINLQGQLLNSELPLLARSLGTGAATDGTPGFSYALLKGRANYLCDNRLDALFRAPPSLDGMGAGISPEELGDLAAWRSATPTGEREDFGGRPTLWPLINADPHDCAPTACRFREACFYLGSVKRARDAQVLVVNHALLAANLVSRGALFPMDDRVLIIDEAHRLPEALSSAYGAHLTLGKALHLSRSARRRDPARASRYADALEWAAERYFRDLTGITPGAVEDDGVLPDPEALGGSLVALRNVLQGSPAGQARAVAGMAKQLLRDLRSFYKGGGTHARAVLARGGGRAPELRSWLVDVGPAFAWDVVARSRPDDDAGDNAERAPVGGAVTVLCSATLATGSGPERSFAHARRTLGVPLLLKTRPGTRYEEHRAEEVFDYERRALIYLERRLPEPGRDNAEEYARACALRTAELLEASRGRALVLLSTTRAVGLFREHLDVPYPVRYGTDGAPTGPLVEWLKTTPNAVLVGTRSLWEGVDVAGPQVSLVVIDKVPFAAPSDPVNKALVERAGPDWFRLVSLPAAQVALRQGAGRLIRSASDRGVLALLDPRVSTRRWGRQIVSSLPPAPVASSLDRVRNFLAD